MYKSAFLLPALLCFTVICSAQLTFQTAYGGNRDNTATSLKQTNDGGYIIAGSTSSFTADSNVDVYVVRTDANGDTLWTKTYGGSGYDGASDVELTGDSGFIIVGSTSSFGAGLDDIYVIRTDLNGDTLWTKAYGGTDDDEGYDIKQTTDGGFIITGSTLSYGAGFEDVYVVKTDGSGNVQWSKTYGGTSVDVGNSVRQTSDGGYIIAGETFSFGAGDLDAYLIKTDAGGTVQWSKTYGGPDDDDALCIQQTTDHGYIITGYTASFGAGNYDVFLIKTDVNGNVDWSKAYGGTDGDEGYAVQQTTDGGYIVCGSTSNFGSGNTDVYLIKTNAGGDTLWSQAYGGTGFDAANDIHQTTDNGYIVTGYTDILNPGGPDDIYLIKTDALGNAGCNGDSTATVVTVFTALVANAATLASSGDSVNVTATLVGNGGSETILCTTVGIHEISENNSVTLFPNPFSTTATLVINTPLPASPKESGVLRTNFLLTVYNVMGQVVQQSEMKGKTTVIDRTGLQDGMYFYRVSNERQTIASGKLIVQ